MGTKYLSCVAPKMHGITTTEQNILSKEHFDIKRPIIPGTKIKLEAPLIATKRIGWSLKLGRNPVKYKIFEAANFKSQINELK